MRFVHVDLPKELHKAIRDDVRVVNGRRESLYQVLYRWKNERKKVKN